MSDRFVIDGDPSSLELSGQDIHLVVADKDGATVTAPTLTHEITAAEVQREVIVDLGSPSAFTQNGEEGMPLSQRLDQVSDSLMYRGEAPPGSPETAPVWRIKRIEIGDDGDVTTTWAGGTGNFTHPWSQRAELTYQ